MSELHTLFLSLNERNNKNVECGGVETLLSLQRLKFRRQWPLVVLAKLFEDQVKCLEVMKAK
jgi:hypothetical protein